MIPDDQNSPRGAMTPEAQDVVRAAMRVVTEEWRVSPSETETSSDALRAAMRYADVTASRVSPKAVWSARWYVFAAVFLAVIGLAAAWRMIGRRRAGHADTSSVTYATANGQRARITLPDGSTVALNVASRLDVPVDYGRGNHTLHLRGEALFTVTRSAETPFVVIAGATTARVLGTSFVVRDYATDGATTVAVREGKVAVRSDVVTADREVDVGRDGQMAMCLVAPNRFSFARGVLALDSVAFSAAIGDLDRWYDADIRLGDPSLATRKVTGQWATGSLGDLATMLEWTFNLRVVRNGRVLTLYPR